MFQNYKYFLLFSNWNSIFTNYVIRAELKISMVTKVIQSGYVKSGLFNVIDCCLRINLHIFFSHKSFIVVKYRNNGSHLEHDVIDDVIQ